MKKGSNVGNTLSDFIHEFGALSLLTFDSAAVQKGNNTLFYKNSRRLDIEWHIISPRRPKENAVNVSVQELKGRWHHMQSKHNITCKGEKSTEDSI